MYILNQTTAFRAHVGTKCFLWQTKMTALAHGNIQASLTKWLAMAEPISIMEII